MKLFIAGHHGMVGGALVRRLQQEPGVTLLLRRRRELDLTSQAAVEAFYQAEKPDVAIIAAAKVGGIHANNTYPAEFLFENLAIAANTIHSAYRAGTKRLLFLGSSCIYPKHAPQPMPEDCLLTGPLEPTNEAYAIAKIAGLKLTQYYRKQYGVLFHSAMPTNLYGPGDNYHPQNSHVLPALIRRFDEARAAGKAEVVAWGTGSPRREFLHVDDLADACAFLLRQEDGCDHPGVDGNGGRRDGLQRPDCVGRHQAGWHSAEADGCFPADGARVESAAGLAGGHREDLCELSVREGRGCIARVMT
jgi:GDP-L-fucose synthase